ncbi:MAG: MBL fold metallo-hydrolase [Thermodesulfobacteriota bacterium]|nr:MBL fold metallo-hydrolase [Thermodesulfobacteriota bacterium]
MSIEKSSTVQIEEADRVEVTTIIDNYIDSTLAMSEPPSEMIKRPMLAKEGKIPAQGLLAEHGLCLLVKVFKGDQCYSVLLDSGWSKIGIFHNMKMLGVDVSQIEAVVISHGHMDHCGALPEILDSISPSSAPVIIHPDAFLQRMISLQGGITIEMPTMKESSINKAGIEVIKTKRPHSLASGLVFSLGEVERITDFEEGMPGFLIKRNNEFEPDSIIDDQGLVIHLKGKGLVIITGCAHSGIINTIEYAKKITRVDTIYAVMGGFHLTGPQFMLLTDRTVEELKKVKPSIIIPMHCTCWVTMNWIEREFPDQFILNSVGTTFSF